MHPVRFILGGIMGGMFPPLFYLPPVPPTVRHFQIQPVEECPPSALETRQAKRQHAVRMQKPATQSTQSQKGQSPRPRTARRRRRRSQYCSPLPPRVMNTPRETSPTTPSTRTQSESAGGAPERCRSAGQNNSSNRLKATSHRHLTID